MKNIYDNQEIEVLTKKTSNRLMTIIFANEEQTSKDIEAMRNHDLRRANKLCKQLIMARGYLTSL